MGERQTWLFHPQRSANRNAGLTLGVTGGNRVGCDRDGRTTHNRCAVQNQVRARSACAAIHNECAATRSNPIPSSSTRQQSSDVRRQSWRQDAARRSRRERASQSELSKLVRSRAASCRACAVINCQLARIANSRGDRIKLRISQGCNISEGHIQPSIFSPTNEPSACLTMRT